MGSIIFLYFILQKGTITGKIISEYYSYTKAICNETNYCQDYEIMCDGGNLISMKPITGAVIQHPNDWTDSRNNSDTLCK